MTIELTQTEARLLRRGLVELEFRLEGMTIQTESIKGRITECEDLYYKILTETNKKENENA